MKKHIILSLLLTGFLFGNANAQLNVNVNIGVQPSWGPSGYKYVDYYYLPDMDAYYYVPKKQFIYFNGSNWLFVPRPPVPYRNVDLYRTYKVVINEPRPWLRHNVYQVKYKQYKGYYGKQKIIKDNPPGHAYGHYKDKGPAKHKQHNNGHRKGNGHGHEN